MALIFPFAICLALTFTFYLFTFALIDGQGRNRTADAGLFRAALYQLSYLAWIFHISSGKSAV
jgi:hypothetical protein